MDEQFRAQLTTAINGVRDATGLSLEFEHSSGGCFTLSAHLESGRILVATELDRPWSIGIYRACNGTRPCLLDDAAGTHYPNGCGKWCDHETAEFFEFVTQFDQLPACIVKALSTYAALTDRHATQPINEHGHPKARVHRFDQMN